MRKRTLVISSVVAFVLAVIASVLLRTTVLSESNDSLLLALDVVCAGLAGRVVLGRRRPFRYFTLGIVVFSALAAGFLTSAVTTYLLSNSVVVGHASGAASGGTVASAITGAVLYLVAATLYGFAGAKTEVRLPHRIGLLLLLLLAVVPVANILGTLGFVVLAFFRVPRTIPARSEVSE